MKIIDVVQGSPEWHAARLGIPTCSQADRILTPKTLKPSSQAATYRNQLLAEWLLGYPIDWTGASQWMERGTEMEGEARAAYELETGADVETVGLILRDDGMFAGSPDGLVGDDGGLEIKCPAIHTHIGYLLHPDSLADEYRGQVQSILALTGRDWWDLYAYNPELPSVRVRITRDAEYASAFNKALSAFVADLRAARARLREYQQAPLSVEAEPAAEPDHAGDLSVLMDATTTRGPRSAIGAGR